MTAKDRLHDILYAGLGPDIYLAERARQLHRAVGLLADEINAAGFGELFGTVQNAAVGELTLNVAKLFERASNRHPVRSIPAVIGILQEYAAELDPMEPTPALADLSRAGIDVSSLKSLSGPVFTRQLGSLLHASCPDPKKADACDLSRSLNAMRASRDKAIAHNEAVDRDSLPRAKWSEAEKLLDYAKNVSAGLAMAYFTSAWTDDSGRFSTSHDAGVAASQLRRLLKAANIPTAAV
jgi:hypothetical protein